MISTRVRDHCYRFFAESHHSLAQKRDFRKKCHIGAQAFRALEIEYQSHLAKEAERSLSVEKAVRKLGLMTEPDIQEEIELETEEIEVQEVMTALKKMAVESKNAFAAKTWLQVKGRLTEKSEVTHKLDGSFFARASVEAERQLRKEGSRVDEVQEKPKILRYPLRLPSEQNTEDYGPI